MPTYDFLCADCDLVFEGLVSRNERPGCPTCNGKRTERQFSPPTSNRRVEPVSEERAPEPDVVEETSVKASAPAGEGVDRLEHEWRDRQPTPALDRTKQTLRRDAPEIWDLERDFERRQADQLAEIGEKSQRLVKLMERIESLEPLLDEIALRDRELGQLKETVCALEETERAVGVKLERRTRTLYDVKTEAEGLRATILKADEDARERDVEIEALRQQIDERDLRLEEARTHQAALERELQERNHRAEDANHERDAIKAELESRTAALFKRDELIQEADEQIAGLREEIRERDRCVADANQRNEALRTDLEAIEGEVQLRDAAVLTLEEHVDRLDEELATVRDELTQANEALEARERENQELSEAQVSTAGAVELTQSLLAELKPLFESLETTIGPGLDEEKAALPSEGTEIVGSSND